LVPLGKRPVLSQLDRVNLGPATNEPERSQRQVAVKHPKTLYSDLRLVVLLVDMKMRWG
jgi:hypothetical protein